MGDTGPQIRKATVGPTLGKMLRIDVDHPEEGVLPSPRIIRSAEKTARAPRSGRLVSTNRGDSRSIRDRRLGGRRRSDGSSNDRRGENHGWNVYRDSSHSRIVTAKKPRIPRSSRISENTATRSPAVMFIAATKRHLSTVCISAATTLRSGSGV
jgi:hypothetical protein